MPWRMVPVSRIYDTIVHFASLFNNRIIISLNFHLADLHAENFFKPLEFRRGRIQAKFCGNPESRHPGVFTVGRT